MKETILARRLGVLVASSARRRRTTTTTTGCTSGNNNVISLATRHSIFFRTRRRRSSYWSCFVGSCSSGTVLTTTPNKRRTSPPVVSERIVVGVDDSTVGVLRDDSVTMRILRGGYTSSALAVLTVAATTKGLTGGTTATMVGTGIQRRKYDASGTRRRGNYWDGGDVLAFSASSTGVYHHRCKYYLGYPFPIIASSWRWRGTTADFSYHLDYFVNEGGLSLMTRRRSRCLSTLSGASSSSSSSQQKQEQQQPLSPRERRLAKRKKKEEDKKEEEERRNNVEFDNAFATDYHAPVMARECIDAMFQCQRNQDRRRADSVDVDVDVDVDNVGHVDKEGERKRKQRLVFVDGTLGGGGHSMAILNQLLPGDVLIGADIDPNALNVASDRLSRYLPDNHDGTTLPYFIPIQCNFRNLSREVPRVLSELLLMMVEKKQEEEESSSGGCVVDEDDVKIFDDDGLLPCVDAILMDLGVSSHQIDTPERGFAFMQDGPLDMRMGSASSASASVSASSSSAGLSAADICNEFDEDELSRILKKYGDEPRSRIMARAIIQHRPYRTTGDLREAVSSVTPAFVKKSRRMGRMATLARVFQSLRIVVNDEEEALAEALSGMCPKLVRCGGRLVVLSYHSMEDRATKRIMRDGTLDPPRRRPALERDMYGNVVGGSKKPWKMLGKGRKATDGEILVNSRARSATLRVAERLPSSSPGSS